MSRDFENNFPECQPLLWHHLALMKRELRADLLLAENIRTLLSVRGIDAGALATWCGHRAAWISKILNGERGVQTRELGKVADFFGLTVAQLFQHGISPLTERRRSERRTASERRSGQDRRQPFDGSKNHHSVDPFRTGFQGETRPKRTG